MRFRVCDVARFPQCPERSKLQALRRVDKVKGSNPLLKGKEMHFYYSVPYKSFDRRLLRYKLTQLGRSFTRDIDKHVIAGRPDDYRVLFCYPSGSKVVSIIEVKTTSVKRLWATEVAVAIFQLQLYIWLMEPILTQLGYTLHYRHYVEVYSQKTGKLLRRVVVYKDPNIEQVLHDIFRAWLGMKRMTLPKLYVCKKCPRQVKRECFYWQTYQKHKTDKRLY